MTEDMSPKGTNVFRALVIGVDSYPQLPPRAQLSGCVNDAIAIRQFLLEHLQVPPKNIRFFLSGKPVFKGARADDPELCKANVAHASASLADSKSIRNAFEALLAEVQEGDEVILFVASHGVRVSNPATGEYVYGFAPADTEGTPTGFANLILGKELNRLTREITKRKANPTIIADTCHSASSVRALFPSAVRRLPSPDGSPEWKLSAEDWKLFVSAHPALAQDAAAGHVETTRGGSGGSGWGGTAMGDGDWVMLAACRDIEVAGEYAWKRNTPNGLVVEPHGMMTGSLLVELQKVPKPAIRDLRWMHLHPNVRKAVQTLASSQSPTLEGRAERTVFGGKWTPFQPGFVVRPGQASGMLEVAAGELHGLEENAEIDVFPPETADFDEVRKNGKVLAHAVVVASTPVSCTARVVSGSVAANARGVLVKPSPKAARTRVLLAGEGGRQLSEQTIKAIKESPGASDYLVFVDALPADMEVVPWKDGRWALVTSSETRTALDADEVIAYIGKEGAAASIGDALLGDAIGDGLVHWSRYLRVRDRKSLAPSLTPFVSVKLHVGKPESARKEDCPVHEAQGGVHEVTEGAPLWVEVRIAPVPERRVFVGIVGCSDDGNVMTVWPPQGGDASVASRGATEYDLPSGQSLWVGVDQHTPLLPTVRADQAHSIYTMKAFVIAQPKDAPAPDLSSLAIDQTVQDVVDASIARGAARGAFKGMLHPLPSVPIWLTQDIRVRVARAKA